MINNMKIKSKIISAISIFSVITFSIIVYSIFQMSFLNTVVNDLSGNRIPKIATIYKISKSVNTIARSTRAMVIFKNNEIIAEEKAQILKNQIEIETHLTELKSTIVANKDLLEKIINVNSVFLREQSEFLSAFDSKNNDLVYSILWNKLRHSQHELLNLTTQLITIQLELSKEEAEKGSEAMLFALVIITVCATASLLFIFIGSRIIIMSIVNPIQSLEKTVTEISEQGNFNAKIDVDLESKDELSSLGRCFQRMMKDFREMQSDTEMLIQSAVEGKLTIRANAIKYKGDFKKIVEGINKILDTMLTPLNLTVDYVEKIGKGNIPPKIESGFEGDFTRLRTSLNSCIDNLNGLTNEMANIAIQQKAGDIEAFADEKKFEGSYSTIMNGYNEGLRLHIRNILLILDLLKEYSEGNLTKEMVTLPGKQIIATTRINLLRSNIINLIDEMNRMSREHDAGDIDVKIPIEKFQGSYKTMAEGINTMVFGHIAIKKKAMACVKEFGEGNFDAPLETFPGKKVFINETIEQVRTNLKELISDAQTLSIAAIEGNLTNRADATKHQGDFRKIIEGFNKTLDAVIEPIQETASVLDELSNNNLSVYVMGEYKGDHAKIANALNNTIDSFSAIITQIKNASEQMLQSSTQLADSSQNLATGSSEQASSTEEVTSALYEIESQSKNNSEASITASDLSKNVNEKAAKGNKEMEDLLHAMNELNISSEKISKVVKEIESIAFQTNILALNAAVEAARAGQHGKGFNVVATEVRNLAIRSSNSAKETSVMVEETIKKITSSAKLAESNSESLKTIVDGITKLTELVSGVALSSNEQKLGIAQVNSGINEIAKVTMSNSASAEEMATASEELTGQAKSFNEMVSIFKIKDDTNGNSKSNEKGTKRKIKL